MPYPKDVFSVSVNEKYIYLTASSQLPPKDPKFFGKVPPTPESREIAMKKASIANGSVHSFT